MDRFKKRLAPISDAGWEFIGETSEEIFSAALTGRKFVEVSEEKGEDYAAEGYGRLTIPPGVENEDVKYGIHRVQPLLEARVSFEVDLWELDNLERGANDVELEELESAARKLADFEEKAIYYGIGGAAIQGLVESSKREPLEFEGLPESFLDSVSEAALMLKESHIDGPYSLVVGREDWKMLSVSRDSYPLKKRISDIIDGRIIFSNAIKEAFLITERGGDFQLTLGKDVTVGYQSRNEQNAKLYFTESFTFRVNDPESYVIINKSNKL